MKAVLRSWRTWFALAALALAAHPIAWLPELLVRIDPQLAAALRLIRAPGDALRPDGPLDAWGRPWRFYFADWEGRLGMGGEEVRQTWEAPALPRVLRVDGRFYVYFDGPNGVDQLGQGDDEFFLHAPGWRSSPDRDWGPYSLGPDGLDGTHFAWGRRSDSRDDVWVQASDVRAALRVVDLVRLGVVALGWVALASGPVSVPARGRMVSAIQFMLLAAPLLTCGALGASLLTPWLEGQRGVDFVLVPPAFALHLTAVAGVVVLVASLRIWRRPAATPE